MMSNPITAEQKDIALKTVEALNKNRFHASYFSTVQEAVDTLLADIPTNATVGVGGSWTFIQLNIVDTLEARGNTVYYHHKPGLRHEEVLETRRKQLTCDVFLTSSNAITEDGRLINVDGTGNRVAAMMFGPKKVIVLAGINKIVANLEEGEERIRMTAAPLNNKRLKLPNPCVQAGHCMDCQGSSRICNITTVIHKQPTASNIHVWIVGEELGF